MTTPVKAVELSVSLAGSSRRADKSAGIRLVTATEAPVELMTWLDTHHGECLTALLTIDSEAEAKRFGEPPPKESRKGSPSQQLHRHLWGEYNMMAEHGRTEMTFEQYYPTRMLEIMRALEEGKL